MSPDTQPSTRPGRRFLAWTISTVLITTLSPTLAQAQAGTESEEAEAPPASAESPAADPNLVEAARYFKEAEERGRRGHHVAAADLYIAAYDLLDDPRKYRNQRGTALAKIYDALLTAYEAAESDNARIDHACRLRNLMGSYLADLKSGYGEASEGFSEVHIARDKLRGLDLTIAAHGDPETLCADSTQTERKRVAMLGPASLGPASLVQPNKETETPETSQEGPEGPEGPSEDDFSPELEPARDRKAIALTAVGGTAIGLGAASLGVMATYLARGANTTAELQTLHDALVMRGEDAVLTEAEEARSATLNGLGKQYDKIALGTGIGGGVALISGVILTAVGGKRLRSRQVSMAPKASLTSLGATLHLRF